MNEKKRYLNCKYLDAGMDGMLCSMSLCTTCKEFNGEKCLYYIPKNKSKDKEYNKYLKLDVVECDTPEKAEIIKNLPHNNEERKEVKKPKFDPNVWNDKEMIEEMEMAKDIEDACNNTSVCNYENEIRDCDKCRAKYLIEQGYRKIDKDSVVLSREEYESYQKTREYNSLLEGEIEHLYDDRELVKKIHDKQLKKERKETAETILRWLKDHLSCMGFSIVKAYFQEQFGVEIKEDIKC